MAISNKQPTPNRYNRRVTRQTVSTKANPPSTQNNRMADRVVFIAAVIIAILCGVFGVFA